MPSSMSTATQNVLERIRASARSQKTGEWHDLSFAALGSPCRVRFAAPTVAAKALPGEIIQWVAEFEARYSRFIPTSLISDDSKAFSSFRRSKQMHRGSAFSDTLASAISHLIPRNSPL